MIDCTKFSTYQDLIEYKNNLLIEILNLKENIDKERSKINHIGKKLRQEYLSKMNLEKKDLNKLRDKLVKVKEDVIKEWENDNKDVIKLKELRNQYSEIIKITGGISLQAMENRAISHNEVGILYSYRIKPNFEWLHILMDIMKDTYNIIKNIL